LGGANTDCIVHGAAVLGDCAIRGTANDILLALWRRLPLSELDVVGDRDVAERFIAHTGND